MKNSLKENHGLIKTNIENLEKIFNSEAFRNIYSKSEIEIKKFNGDDNPLELEPDQTPPKKPQEPVKPTILPHKPQAPNKPYKPLITITSVQYKGNDGFIEFEAKEFPLATLKELAKECLSKPLSKNLSKPLSKPSFEVVWLNPDKSKFTHTKFEHSDKGIGASFKEHDFNELENLFKADKADKADKAKKIAKKIPKKTKEDSLSL